MPSAVLDQEAGTYTIPAAHTNRLAAILAGKQSAPVPIDCIIQQIFSPDFTDVYDVPVGRITKLSGAMKGSRLVLCSEFDPAIGPTSCRTGEKCPFVHADIRGLQHRTAHINYAWVSVDAVSYERLPPGTKLEVAAPGSHRITDYMDTSMVLKTKAILSTRRPLSHCAHYYFNRVCNHGPSCQFVHAVYVDPHAKPLQRAPPPAHLGRSMLPKAAASVPFAKDNSDEFLRQPHQRTSTTQHSGSGAKSLSTLFAPVMSPTASMTGSTFAGSPFVNGQRPPNGGGGSPLLGPDAEVHEKFDSLVAAMRGEPSSARSLHRQPSFGTPSATPSVMTPYWRTPDESTRGGYHADGGSRSVLSLTTPASTVPSSHSGGRPRSVPSSLLAPSSSSPQRPLEPFVLAPAYRHEPYKMTPTTTPTHTAGHHRATVPWES